MIIRKALPQGGASVLCHSVQPSYLRIRWAKAMKFNAPGRGLAWTPDSVAKLVPSTSQAGVSAAALDKSPATPGTAGSGKLPTPTRNFTASALGLKAANKENNGTWRVSTVHSPPPALAISPVPAPRFTPLNHSRFRTVTQTTRRAVIPP